MARVSPTKRIVWAVILFGTSSFWYGWLFSADTLYDTSVILVGALGILPIALAIACSVFLIEGRIDAILVVSISMILAQSVTYYPHSPDAAFHLGKILWAARGESLVDPVMGLPSPYPWAYHLLWGEICRFTSSSAGWLLRWSSVWNVTGIILATVVFAPRLVARDAARWVPWVAALALYMKDSSHILLPGPSGFSFPVALTGWWMILSGKSRTETVLGGCLCIVAAIIWPPHLFGLGGVALVLILRRHWGPRTLVVSIATFVSTVAVWAMRRLSVPHESWTNIGIIPHFQIEDIPRIVVHVITIGADSNGVLPALGAIVLTALLLFLIVIGWRQLPAGKQKSVFGSFGLGLLVAVIGAIWIIRLPAHWSRIFSLAALLAAPLAASGLNRLIVLMSGRYINFRRISIAVLGSVWLVPFLVASIVNAQRQSKWEGECAPTVEQLVQITLPGERVWATPSVMRDVVMGTLPLYGFLGHRWPAYFGMPDGVSDSIKTVYDQLRSRGPQPHQGVTDFRDAGVSLVILRRGVEESLPIGKRLKQNGSPYWGDSSFVVFVINEL